jgi:hypothetical protein
MWAVESFFEIYLNPKESYKNSFVEKIPIMSFLTDDDSFILSDDRIIKSYTGWSVSHNSLIYQLLIPYSIYSCIIIKKQHKYFIKKLSASPFTLL